MLFKFKIFSESTKPDNANRAVRKMKNLTNSDFKVLNTELYLNKGCLTICEKKIDSSTWEEFIFEMIKFAQHFGRAWTVTGDITEELNITTNSFHAGNGITMAHIVVNRNEFSP